jgi:LTXXQ motif family protein
VAMIGVRIAALGLALAVLCPSPQASAFGIRLGPFLLSGGRAHHHHRHVVRRPTEAVRTPTEALRRPTEALRRPTEALAPEATPTDDVAQNRTPSLLYPILAWPSLADDIFLFWPTNRFSWPFSYQSIFDQAFAEYPAKRVADLCPHQLGESDATLRIGRAIAPTAAQEPLLQNLSTALAQANGYLIKSCPAEIPPLPVERLQLMDSQIDAMTMALEIVRVPLQSFEQSLNDTQRALLSARMATEPCAKNPEPANWPMPILKQALQPTAAQEAALKDLERAFNRAANELNADCYDDVPRMRSARLQVIEGRLDRTWVAVQTIQVAVAQFQKQLSDQQRARFNALQLATTP